MLLSSTESISNGLIFPTALLFSFIKKIVLFSSICVTLLRSMFCMLLPLCRFSYTCWARRALSSNILFIFFKFKLLKVYFYCDWRCFCICRVTVSDWLFTFCIETWVLFTGVGLSFLGWSMFVKRPLSYFNRNAIEFLPYKDTFSVDFMTLR